MNILITGSNGQLGRSIKDQSQLSTDRYIFTDIDSLDICDAKAVNDFINTNNIDLIINCAAYTNVEKAEADEANADMINALAVENLARIAKQHDIFLFHISTDYIFDGNHNTPIKESQKPSPQSAYGRTKLHGEQAIHRLQCKALIFRTAWLYSEYGHNFVKTMLNLMDNRPEISVVIDQIGSPTYARDLANTIIEIISSRKYEGREGIYNYSNEGICSWYDFAKHISYLSNKTDCKVSPCSSIQFPSKVNRPAYSVLDKSKIIEFFGINIPYWTDSLETCINKLLSNGYN